MFIERHKFNVVGQEAVIVNLCVTTFLHIKIIFQHVVNVQVTWNSESMGDNAVRNSKLVRGEHDHHCAIPGPVREENYGSQRVSRFRS